MSLKTIFFTLLLTSSALTAQDAIPDIDKDNIPDNRDNCLQTPKGVCVTGSGCTQKIKEVVYFDIDSYEIDGQTLKTLESINNIAMECYGYKILITGHADSTYKEGYNLNLSKLRAEKVQQYLIKAGIDTKRITVRYIGEAKPAATNVTREGRSKNRRVEIIFY